MKNSPAPLPAQATSTKPTRVENLDASIVCVMRFGWVGAGGMRVIMRVVVVFEVGCEVVKDYAEIPGLYIPFLISLPRH